MVDSPATGPIVPDELRMFRNRLGLSQRALAAALSISTRGVEEWESGRRAPPLYLRLALERLAISIARSGNALALREMLPVDELRDVVEQLELGRA